MNGSQGIASPTMRRSLPVTACTTARPTVAIVCNPQASEDIRLQSALLEQVTSVTRRLLLRQAMKCTKAPD